MTLCFSAFRIADITSSQKFKFPFFMYDRLDLKHYAVSVSSLNIFIYTHTYVHASLHALKSQKTPNIADYTS